MPPIPVLLIIGIVLILFSLMVCQEGGRLLKESEFYFSFSFCSSLPLFSWGWQARSKKLEEEEEEDTVYSVVFVFFTNAAYDCTHNIDDKVSDKNGGLFPKIDKKNLLTVPELVTPPGTVDEEEEASISVSQPNAIESINCSFLLKLLISFPKFRMEKILSKRMLEKKTKSKILQV